MKSLRRSLNTKDSGGPPISPPVTFPQLQKPRSAILPPKKVIRALEPYRPQAPQELGFAKGDFFYVVSEVSGGEGWYEAHNPVSGARGLVPKACFEEFQKANAVARAVSPAISSTTSPPPPASSPSRSSVPQSPGGSSSTRHQTYYAVVLHDFTAERTDELEARAGDPITVVAQSNAEWFVAKPIGKLGRPGLIPATFVELRDPASNRPIADVAGIIARGELPKVEDWKRAMQEYKQSSITLGVIDERSGVPGERPKQPVFSAPPLPAQSPYGVQPPASIPARPMVPMELLSDNRPPTPVSMQDPTLLPPGVLLTAEVVDFHFENDEYWFRINAVYQPEDHQTAAPRQLVLFRVYDDFYDFQIALLDAFPVEAGREIGPPSPQSEGNSGVAEPTRILPYMPGPVPQVDNEVTALRRDELDDYLGQLCALRDINAEHVLRHPLVRSFFSPKPGDLETPLPAMPVTERSNFPDHYDYGQREQQYQDMRGGLGSLSLTSNGGHVNDTFRYEDDGAYGRTPGYDYSNAPGERLPSRNGANAHARGASAASPGVSPYDPKRPGYNTGRATPSDRIESPRNANPVSNPPISAANSQTAFLKIKIFHRRTDDLIAIRVNPRLSHMELMEKIRERLGDVQSVSYRNSLTGGYTDLCDDYSLREWVDHADKHVLYAL